MMANCLESRLSAARLQSAGISLRLVKSPVAPKMTITQGAATVFIWAWFMSGRPLQCHGVVRVAAFGRSSLLFRVPAELKAHGGQNLGGKVAFPSRQETLVQRFRKHRGRSDGLDAGKNGPAAFAGIGNAAGETLEGRRLEPRNGRQGEKPGGAHADSAQ